MTTSCSSALAVLGTVAVFCVWSTKVQSSQESVADSRQQEARVAADAHLIGWWKFDESSGKSAADSSGHGHDAVLEGGMSFDSDSVQGRDGKALRFDWQGQLVRVPGFKGVTGTSPRTVCAWVKTSMDGGEIVSWGSDDYGNMWIFGYVRGRIGVNPKGGYLYMNDSIADDKWHHVAVVVNEAEIPNLHDHVRLFKDGVPAVIHDIGLLDLWPIDTGSELDVSIGRGFKGLIDDLRIYDRALSEEEIEVLFKLQTPKQNAEKKGAVK